MKIKIINTGSGRYKGKYGKIYNIDFYDQGDKTYNLKSKNGVIPYIEKCNCIELTSKNISTIELLKQYPFEYEN